MFNKSMLLQPCKQSESVSDSVTFTVIVGSWPDWDGYTLLGYDRDSKAGSISNDEFLGTKINQIVFTSFDGGESDFAFPPGFESKIRFDDAPFPYPNKLHVKVESEYLHTDQTEYVFDGISNIYLGSYIEVLHYGDFPVTVTITPYDFE